MYYRITMDVPANVIVAGNPAVVIEEFTMIKGLGRP
jgi:acetyltransferase-like isoleucine patch superfamily enzyme